MAASGGVLTPLPSPVSVQRLITRLCQALAAYATATPADRGDLAAVMNDDTQELAWLLDVLFCSTSDERERAIALSDYPVPAPAHREQRRRSGHGTDSPR